MNGVKSILEGNTDHMSLPTLKGKTNNTKLFMENWRLPDEVGVNVRKKDVVAEGGVDIRALPDVCSTWVNLIDNVLSPKPVVTLEDVNLSPPEGCPTSIFKADFNEGSYGGFISSLGGFSIFDPTDETLANFTTISRAKIKSEGHDGTQLLKLISKDRV